MRETIVTAILTVLALASAGCDTPVRPSAPKSAVDSAPVPVANAPRPPSSAVLVATQFKVQAVPDKSGQFWCTVKSLGVTETSGRIGGWVTNLHFHLDTESAADGNVPSDFSVRKRVDAGASMELIGPPDMYGEEEYQFGGSHTYQTVSVTITYVDDDGGETSVAAVSQVASR